MNKLIISILLLCTALWPCRAQVNPDGKPGLTWNVAQIDGVSYPSLTSAFGQIKADGASVKLLMGVTHEKPLSVTHTATLDLNNLPLVCASGTSFEIAGAKVLTLQGGTVSGSLQLTGGGSLFAGEDVKIGALGVTSAAGESLFRILVELPGNEADGTVSEIFYGSKTVTQYARRGKVFCCWLPQSVETLSLTYKYTKGSNPVKYSTSPLIVIQHAAKAVPSAVAQAGGGNVAQVQGGNSYATLLEAFGAVRASGGTITLLDNATLSTQVQNGKPVTLDLAKWGLNATGLAAVNPATGGSLWIKNGLLSGSLTIGERVTADKSVTLTAAITQSGRPVYRTRLLLPADLSDKTLTYTYGELSGAVPTPVTEEGKQVAYLWLPSHTAAPFVLVLTPKAGASTTKTKYAVTIQTNHSNEIDLQKGDIEAILYKENEVPNTDPGTPYETFHDALNASGALNASQVWLQRDVSFSGATDHDHTIQTNVITELHLNGHTMSATNCTLDATAPDACLRICDADKGLGNITGTFRIKGNVYIGKDLIANKIGTVLDGNGQTIYRVLLLIDGGASLGGLATYKVEDEANAHACYIEKGTACIWLPAGELRKLTLNVEATEYAASGVTVSATHSNTVTVRKPAVVAKIGTAEYTSLTEAFTQAADGHTILLQQNTTLDASVSIADKKLTLDLQEFTLSMQSAAGFAPSGLGNLLINSDSQRGVLSGNFTVTEQVCVDASVSISGLATLSGKQVYRTCFYLPNTATAGTWEYNQQSGTLFFHGKSATGQAAAYGWIGTEYSPFELKANLTNPSGVMKTLPSITLQDKHTNRFDMEAGTNVAKVGDQYYATFESALVEANKAGGTIVLVANQTLRGKQEVKQKVTLDLQGCQLSLTADASFYVDPAESLYITSSGGSIKGFLYGTLLLEGPVYVDPEVKLSGTVVRGGQEVSRLLVTGLPEATDLQEIEFSRLTGLAKEQALWLKNTACLWIPTAAAEDELLFVKDGTTYETALPASLSGHNNEQKAYKRIEVGSGETTWSDDTNKDCNVLLQTGAILTISTDGPSTLHRLTIEKGAQVITDKNVLATGGIVHRRAFDAGQVWEPFSLPYEAKRITAVVDKKIVELSPNLSTGTGGHFWLQTLAADGSFRHVAEETLRANVGYVIAVPDGLTTTSGRTDMAVSFASAPNQYLKRTEVVGTAPTEKGFRQFATGLLKDMEIPTAFYQLDAAGQEYVRQAAGGTVPPFSSYLLADAQTTATTRSLRLDNLPASNEAMPLSEQSVCLVFGGKRYIQVMAKTACPVHIFTPDGRLKQVYYAPEGETRLPMPSGLYIVNRQKVYVTQ